MKCISGAQQLINQIIQTIEIVTIEDYDKPLAIYNDSTIGGHFRHIYDFFNCIVIQANSTKIDYCNRCRDPRIESDRAYAIAKFIDLGVTLTSLDEDARIVVHADFELASGVRPTVKTTIGREVMYAYDHAVHHLAIVKIGIKSIIPDVEIPQGLGVAASTIRHQLEHDHHV